MRYKVPLLLCDSMASDITLGDQNGNFCDSACENPQEPCDTCHAKGIETAGVIYCHHCRKVFCKAHLQVRYLTLLTSQLHDLTLDVRLKIQPETCNLLYASTGQRHM